MLSSIRSFLHIYLPADLLLIIPNCTQEQLMEVSICTDDDSQILLSQTQAEASLHPAKSKGDVRSHHELVLQRDADPAVLETLQGSHKVLVNQHLPAVLEWLRVVVRVGFQLLAQDLRDQNRYCRVKITLKSEA